GLLPQTPCFVGNAEARRVEAPVMATSGRSRARRRPLTPRWRSTRALQRTLRLVLAAPLLIRLVIFAVVAVALWSAVNWTYHVIRKPTEVFFPVSGTLAKTPPETWRQYAPLFRRHSTATITPELLPSPAHVDRWGDPVARPYWRWQVAWNPFEL